MKTVLPTLPDKTFIYIAPPSYVKGRWLYENHNSHNSHASIAELVKEHITQHWIVSCDNNPEIIEMYKGYPTTICDINHNVHPHCKDAEVMFFSKKLIIPNLKNSSSLKTAQNLRDKHYIYMPLYNFQWSVQKPKIHQICTKKRILEPLSI